MKQVVNKNTLTSLRQEVNFQWGGLRWVKVYPVEKREMYSEAKRGAFSKLSVFERF
jgi:hypothetical protein